MAQALEMSDEAWRAAEQAALQARLAREAEIIDEIAKGTPLSQVAKRCRTTRQTIYVILRRNKVLGYL